MNVYTVTVCQNLTVNVFEILYNLFSELAYSFKVTIQMNCLLSRESLEVEDLREARDQTAIRDSKELRLVHSRYIGYRISDIPNIRYKISDFSLLSHFRPMVSITCTLIVNMCGMSLVI